jgi:DNA gyrase subunit A
MSFQSHDGFDIDEIQADFIAEIKLRNLNKQYIIGKIKEIESLQEEIAKLEEILADNLKIKAYIASQLAEVRKKYGKPRVSQIIAAHEVTEVREEELTENYNVRLYLSREGYFKKSPSCPCAETTNRSSRRATKLSSPRIPTTYPNLCLSATNASITA